MHVTPTQASRGAQYAGAKAGSPESLVNSYGPQHGGPLSKAENLAWNATLFAFFSKPFVALAAKTGWKWPNTVGQALAYDRPMHMNTTSETAKNALGRVDKVFNKAQGIFTKTPVGPDGVALADEGAQAAAPVTNFFTKIVHKIDSGLDQIGERVENALKGNKRVASYVTARNERIATDAAAMKGASTSGMRSWLGGTNSVEQWKESVSAVGHHMEAHKAVIDNGLQSTLKEVQAASASKDIIKGATRIRDAIGNAESPLAKAISDYEVLAATKSADPKLLSALANNVRKHVGEIEKHALHGEEVLGTLGKSTHWTQMKEALANGNLTEARKSMSKVQGELGKFSGKAGSIASKIESTINPHAFGKWTQGIEGQVDAFKAIRDGAHGGKIAEALKGNAASAAKHAETLVADLGSHATNLHVALENYSKSGNAFTRFFSGRALKAELKALQNLETHGGDLLKVVEHTDYNAMKTALDNGVVAEARQAAIGLSKHVNEVMSGAKGEGIHILNKFGRQTAQFSSGLVSAEQMAAKAASAGGVREMIGESFKNFRNQGTANNLIRVGTGLMTINQTIGGVKQISGSVDYLKAMNEEITGKKLSTFEVLFSDKPCDLVKQQRRENWMTTIPSVIFGTSTSVAGQIAISKSMHAAQLGQAAAGMARSSNAWGMGLVFGGMALQQLMPKNEAHKAYVEITDAQLKGKDVPAQKYLDFICSLDKEAAKTGKVGDADVRYVAKAMESAKTAPGQVAVMLEQCKHNNTQMAMNFESQGKQLVNGATGQNYGPGAVSPEEAKAVETNIASGKAVGSMSAAQLQNRSNGVGQMQMA